MPKCYVNVNVSLIFHFCSICECQISVEMSHGSVTTVQVIGRTVKRACLQSFLQIKASQEKSHVYFGQCLCSKRKLLDWSMHFPALHLCFSLCMNLSIILVNMVYFSCSALAFCSV